MRSSGRRSVHHSVLFAIVLALGLSSMATGVLAQDTLPNGAQPPPPIGMESPTYTDTRAEVLPDTVDLSSFCQTGQNGQQSVMQGPVQQVHPNLVPGTQMTTSDPEVSDMVVHGSFQLPRGSKISAIGPEAWFSVTNGVVAVVSCNNNLLFDVSPGDELWLSTPAGVGVLIDSTFLNGVYLSQSGNEGYVWVLPMNDASAEISMEVKVGTSDALFCDISTCFWLGNSYQVGLDAGGSDDGTVTGGGGSCGIRCYGR